MTLIVSTSEIRSLQSCPGGMRYRYEYVLGRRAEGSHDQAWGAALHRGLEAYFMILRREASEASPKDVMAYGLEIALYAAFSTGQDSAGRPYEPPADPYARAALSAILRAYPQYWWTDPATYEIEAVELPFCLPVRRGDGRVMGGRSCQGCGGEGLLRRAITEKDEKCPACSGSGRIRPQREGRIDLVVRERKRWGDIDSMQERLWIVEHKSTLWEPSDERYYTGIEVDLQTALYYDAATELGYNPAGVLYDVIRRPEYETIKSRSKPGEVKYTHPKAGEPAAEYEERIYRMATGEDRHSWFGRRYLPITAEQVRRARQTVTGAVREIQWRERTNTYVQVSDRYHCAKPGRVCPWFRVCSGEVVEGGEEFERLYPLKRKE